MKYQLNDLNEDLQAIGLNPIVESNVEFKVGQIWKEKKTNRLYVITTIYDQPSRRSMSVFTRITKAAPWKEGKPAPKIGARGSKEIYPGDFEFVANSVREYKK